MTSQSREIRLAARPKGWPTAANFSLATVSLPEPREGQVLVRNRFLSVDPYMRARMNESKSYIPPFPVGQALEGGAVGEVVASRAPDLQPGDVVLSQKGWRETFVAEAREVRKVDPRVQPRSAYLGVLGTTGLTAWVGLKLGDVKAGDRVFISAAAGGVGSIAGQLAKQRGCKVVGSAGSAEKVRFLQEELGFDAAFNYKDGSIARQLAAAAPEGIDVYFDNVGGDHLEAAIFSLRDFGRVVACGAISRYNDEVLAPGPRNLVLIVPKRLTIKGFIVLDWMREMPAFLAEVGPLFTQGKLVARETVVDGLDHMAEAFLGQLRGENTGKMIVRLG